MNYLIKVSMIVFLFIFISCKKDPNINPIQDIPNCYPVLLNDTTLQKKIFKIEITGLLKADSIEIKSTSVFNILGNHLTKIMINPMLPYTYSELIYGKKNDLISIIIYNQNTTTLFTTKVFFDNSIDVQQTGYTNSTTKTQTTYCYLK